MSSLCPSETGKAELFVDPGLASSGDYLSSDGMAVACPINTVSCGRPFPGTSVQIVGASGYVEEGWIAASIYYMDTTNLVTTAQPTQLSRVDRLRQLMGENNVGALLVSNLANIRYLTGFSGSAALMLVAHDIVLLTTDSRYEVQVKEETAEVASSDALEIAVSSPSMPNKQKDAIIETVRSSGINSLSMEADNITWAAQQRWAELFAESQLDISFVPQSGLVEQLRLIKDESEIVLMERAASIADDALRESTPTLDSNPTESQFALEVDWWMRRLGAEDRAFDTIVAAGPNGAKPHAKPSSVAIGSDDAVVVDFGAVFGGYRSDMTRTLCDGHLSGEIARVYEIVLYAQQAGIELLRPGVKCADIDMACRKVIEDAGYGEYFNHSTGHGVGLDVHELPVLSTNSDSELQAGMVVTVEPGIYIPNVGGVRIEDMLVITSDGSRSLTSSPK
ncbi:MAG: aminopeptidase P family protein [Actinobacteria bacterium]|nr:aminopeptidase P family protein [Actinomycetota bacterium]